MRIVLFTSKLTFEENGAPIGGSVIDLHLKAKGLLEQGHTVHVVTAFSNADRIPCILPYTVHQRCIRPRGLFGLQCGIYRFLKEFEDEADLFYIDGHMFLYGGGAYRVFGGRVPVTGFFNIRLNLWGDGSGNALRISLFRRMKRGLRYLIERSMGVWLANHLDAFVFNTPQVQKMYGDFGIGQKRPNVVIPDFIATRELMNAHGITKSRVEEHQQGAGKITLFATGRMLPEKGFDLLIRAFSLLQNKDAYRLVISGGGPDQERLLKLVAEMRLERYITFPGWVPKLKVYEFFKEAQIFIFPKWWIEYGSAVLTEAMAFGLPSIIPGGGALEWLTAGSALTFQNGSAEELAKQIQSLGEDAKMRCAFAEKAIARAKELDAQTLTTPLEKVLLSSM